MPLVADEPTTATNESTSRPRGGATRTRGTPFGTSSGRCPSPPARNRRAHPVSAAGEAVNGTGATGLVVCAAWFLGIAVKTRPGESA